MAARNPFTAEELRLVHALYPSAHKAAVLHALPGRSWNALSLIASRLGLRRSYAWPASAIAALREHYPTQGGPFVARLLGKPVHEVTKKASQLHVLRVRPVATPDMVAARKARRADSQRARIATKRATDFRPASQPKPVAEKPTPLLAVKRSGLTPNLNLQKEARRQKEEAPKRTVAITADEVRKLPYHHGGRMAYMLHGQAGWRQWQQQQPA